MTVSLRRIRHSSDPLDLSWVSQLHWPDGPADRTCQNYLPSPTGCHSSLHHLREQQQGANETERERVTWLHVAALYLTGSHYTMLVNRPPWCPHLEIKACSINAELLHQRKRCGLQQVDLQEANSLNTETCFCTTTTLHKGPVHITAISRDALHCFHNNTFLQCLQFKILLTCFLVCGLLTIYNLEQCKKKKEGCSSWDLAYWRC